MRNDDFSALGKPVFYVWMQGGPFATIGELTASGVSVDVSANPHCMKIAFKASFLNGNHTWDVMLDEVPGFDALVAMRNIGVLVYGERHSLWMIDTGERTPSVVRAQGPSVLSCASAQVFWYVRRNRFVCPQGYYGARWVHIKGNDTSRPPRLGLVLRINGSWMVMQFNARTLALAMTHCGYLKPFGIHQRNWQVRLPDGLTLSPIRSVS